LALALGKASKGKKRSNMSPSTINQLPDLVYFIFKIITMLAVTEKEAQIINSIFSIVSRNINNCSTVDSRQEVRKHQV